MMDNRDIPVNATLYQHQVDAVLFVCKLFGMDDEGNDNGGE